MRLMRKPSRAVMILLSIGSCCFALSATVWATWGSARLSGLGTTIEARLTATPTRTPPAAYADAPARLGRAGHCCLHGNAHSDGCGDSDTCPAKAAYRDDHPVPGSDCGAVWHGPGASLHCRGSECPAYDDLGAGPVNRELLISTGDEDQGYLTPAWYGLVGKEWGTFHAFGTYADDGWYLYDDPTGSILIHSAPYELIDGKKVYEDLDALGNYPASHGCIRLTPDDARWFTAWKPQGVPLVILPKKNDAG